jgi:hypothetical protein
MSYLEKEKELVKNTFLTKQINKDAVIYNIKRQQYYIPIYPKKISSYGFASVKPEKIFSHHLLNFYFEPYYEGTTLYLKFAVSNGNGTHKEIVPCKEYFPELCVKGLNSKEELIDAVIILNNKNKNYKNKIYEAKKELESISKNNNEFDILNEEELKNICNNLEEDNKKIEKEYLTLIKELETQKKNFKF